MNKKFLSLSIIYKKTFSLLLSVVILANALSFVSIKDYDFSELNEFYYSTSISKYYNLVSLLPIKLVSEFFSSKINISEDFVVSKKQNDNQKKNNKTEKNNYLDFAFVSSNTTNTFNNDCKALKYNCFGIINSVISIQQNYFNIIISLFILLFISIFKGSMALARDSMDNNKIINKHKVIRLV